MLVHTGWGLCRTTPWLALMGVLCKREQSGTQELISLALGSWFGREDAIWAMQCRVTGRYESASRAAGMLTSLS